MTKGKFNKLNALISILIAFAAWIYVVYNYAPNKDVTYKNVPIQYVGEDTLASRGLAVATSSAETIDVTLSIKRVNFNNISADDIDVYADVSNAIEGDNGISLNITTPEYSTLKSKSASVISIDVAECSSKEVNLALIYSDSTDITAEPVASTISAHTVTVTGATGVVDRVDLAVIKVRVADTTENPMNFVLTPEALNTERNAVEHIVFTPESVSVRAMAGTTKSVKLLVNVSDESGDISYEAPKKITIKGPQSLIKDISEIQTEEIDISGAKAGDEIPLKYVLPTDINVAYSSMGLVLKVTG